MSRKTVVAGLKELVAWGFLEVVRPGGGRRNTTHYRGRIPQLRVEQLHSFARETVEQAPETVEIPPVNGGAAPQEDVQEGVQEGAWLTKVIEGTA